MHIIKGTVPVTSLEGGASHTRDRDNARINGDVDPRVQELLVSHLTTQENARSFTLLSSSTPTDSEAAIMQRSPGLGNSRGTASWWHEHHRCVDVLVCFLQGSTNKFYR